MQQTENTPWDEIAAFLNDSSDQKSKVVIQDWLAASAAHSDLFREIITVWNLTGHLPEQLLPDRHHAWERFTRRIYTKTTFAVRLRRQAVVYAAIAAVVVLAFIGGQWLAGRHVNFLYAKQPLTYATVIAPSGQRTQMVLPDQTKVWLNSGAEISYPTDFSETNRKVRIKGECYFEVKHDAENPFVVHASSIDVKVYGTHFNINEDPVSGKAEVALLKGKVEVFGDAHKTLGFLNPGQQMEVDQSAHFAKIAKIVDSQALIAWTKGMLVFNGQPFEEIIRSLESWYGVKITLDNQLINKHRYTFKVKTESLREVLDFISVITPIAYQVDGNQVYITGLKNKKPVCQTTGKAATSPVE